MKIIIIWMIIFFSFPIYTSAQQDNEEMIINDIIDKQLEELNVYELQQSIQELKLSENQLIDDKNILELIKDIATGRYKFDVKTLIQDAMNIFLGDIRINIKLMLQIIVLSIICSILTKFQTSFINSDISNIALYASYVLIIIIVTKSFTVTMNICKDTITNMVSFMQVFTPLLLIFLTSIGGINTSSVLQPTIAFMVNFIATFFKNTLFVLIFFSVCLYMIDNISDKLHVSNLAGLLKNICVWMIGFTFTIFIGLITIQRIYSTTFDGISIRTAKYAVDTFIPIVGGMFSDSVDTIISCSLLIKNAIGVIGLIIILIICITPLIKIISVVFIYKISSALIQTIGDDRISKCINDVGNAAVLLFLIVVSVSLMFFITIALIIGAGNIVMMMR